MGNKTGLVAILLFLGTLVIYFFTSGGETPYNHFTLLADALIKGNFFVTGNYPWLEKVPINGDVTNFFVVNPPMPAVLLVPLIFLFGKSFPQQYLAHFMGAGLSVLTFFLSLRVKKDVKLALWSGILVGLGSIIWFLSSTGSTWYLGQLTSAFFLTWAILEVTGKSRSILLGIIFGAVYLSRSHVALSFPFIIFLNWKKYKKIKNLLLVILVFLVFATFDFYYNFSRYGSIFNKGYFLIPGTINEPWFSKGIMHPSYIFEDLKIAFFALPKHVSGFPFIIPSWAGMAIWITTPAFIYSFFSPIKKLLTKVSLSSIFLIFMIVGLHGGTGFAQFGYRFAVDFYPFLTLLTILGVAKQKGPRWHHWILVMVGVLINLWGVIWINKFGFVGW